MAEQQPTRVAHNQSNLQTSAPSVQTSWVADGYARQVCNYEKDVLPRHMFSKQRRCITLSEMESLFGFDRNYVAGAFKKFTPKARDIGMSLLGNSYSILVVTWILSFWAVEL